MYQYLWNKIVVTTFLPHYDPKSNVTEPQFLLIACFLFKIHSLSKICPIWREESYYLEKKRSSYLPF